MSVQEQIDRITGVRDQQAGLIAQIKTALDGKAAGGSGGGGGLASAILTVKDFDERCILGYQNTDGELITVTAPANGSTYEIGVPSIVVAIGSYGGGFNEGNCTRISANANDIAVYAVGDCEIGFYGK